jgi:hypothetical protein
VCEYVFRHGGVPLNPFRVFDYFLGERVDRDAIRNGNRRLLEASDEVWVFGDMLADGVLIEIAQAVRSGKHLRFFTIDPDVSAIDELHPAAVTFEPEVLHRTGLDLGTLVEHVVGGTADSVVYALGREHELRGTA